MTTPDSTIQPEPSVSRRVLLAALRWRPTHLIVSVAILLLDVVTGPYIQFPITFVLPVTLAAWFCTRRFAVLLAVLLPIGRLDIAFYIDQQTPLLYSVMNTCIRIVLLVFIAYLVSRTARQTRELAKEVQLLEGILPICSFCKKIRDADQQWHPIETYIAHRSEASFTHSFCPECLKRHYGEVFRE
ncbi:MAG: DUF4118 domain-containing protein [Verrucomicrobia bacterium]|nr:DUF4118 domain-containing protein [Verrucomicrobiota bacterium]